MELSTYFRINQAGTGQFERTMVIADEGSYVSYLEGCTAPSRDENQLHAAVVELIALDNAEIKYSTVQNWFPGNAEGKGGVYNFVGENNGNSATLNGIALVGSTLADGTKKYTATSGDVTGLRLQVSGSANSATVYYGESFFSKLESYVKDLVSSTGTLAKSENQASSSIAEYNEDKVDLEERIEAIRMRYMAQFSAMESAVTGFKKTGEFLTGFIDSLSPDK